MRSERHYPNSVQSVLPRRATLRRLFCISVIAAAMVLSGAWPGRLRGAAPDVPTANVESLVQAGHWKSARAILQPLVNAHPDNARDCYLLAKVDVVFKDLAGALPLAQRAVALDGKVSDYHLEVGEIFGLMAAQANWLSAGPLALKFRKEVETALQLDPRNLDALDAMMEFKYRAPSLMGGDKDEAQAIADRMTLISPSAGDLAHAELADWENDQSQQATCLLKAVQANPRNYQAQTELAKFYTQASHENYQDAIEHARSARQLDPNRVEAYSILARVYAFEGRWAELDRTLTAAEQRVPGDLRPFYEAAQAMLETGKELPKAEDYAKKYLSQEPEGDEPDSADAHRLLALVLEKEGHRTEAREQIQSALQLRPSFKEAKSDRKRLGG